MHDDLSKLLQPVFLEPRDDYWEIHDPEHPSVEINGPIESSHERRPNS